MEPVRVLHVVSVMRRGGVENMIMNLYRRMDQEKIKFDFIVHGQEIGSYEEEIKKSGGKIFHVRTKKESFFGNLADIEKVVRENNYNIIHVHQDAMSMFALKAAKKAGAKARIAHAHATSMPPSKIFSYIYKYAIKRTTKYAAHKFACSKASAKYLFNGDIAETNYLYNGIEIEKFTFSKEVRSKVREENGWNDKFVVGQVANFIHPKNQMHTLNVFAEIVKTREDSVLVFCGEGSDLAECKKRAKELNVEDKVCFLGSVDNVNDFMQAMDVLLLPSFYEGFPVTLVEAQCMGLPCLVSDTITEECKLTDKILYLSLEKPTRKWANEAIMLSEMAREDCSNEVQKKGFDIKQVANWLEDFYLDLK